MYEAFTELLNFAEKVGEIEKARFYAKDGDYFFKGAEISGVTSDGEEFTVELSYERKANPDA